MQQDGIVEAMRGATKEAAKNNLEQVIQGVAAFEAVLDVIAAEAGERAYADGPSPNERESRVEYARLSEAASTASGAAFNVRNVANSHLGMDTVA